MHPARTDFFFLWYKSLYTFLTSIISDKINRYVSSLLLFHVYNYEIESQSSLLQITHSDKSTVKGASLLPRYQKLTQPTLFWLGDREALMHHIRRIFKIR